MKRFELVIKDRKKIIYKSIISFSEKQEKEYLEKISEGSEWDQFSSELEVVVIKSIGIKAWNKNYEMWNNMKKKQCVIQFPDYAICADIMAMVYETPIAIHEFEGLPNLPENSEEVLIDKLPSCPEWICRRIQ